MKKAVLLTSAAMIFSLSLSALTLGKLGDFKFEKANDNVYIMHGPEKEPSKENEGFMNNPAIIESKNGLIIIDPGGNYNVGKKILAEVEKVSKKPVIAIFNTHKHGDHWFANKSFQEKYPNVPIYALNYMIEQVKDNSAETWYGILDRMTGNLNGTKPFAFPTKGIESKQTVVVDGQTFIMRHYARGHTDTDMLIEHTNSNTLFIGDNLIINRFGAFDESSSIHENITLLEKIKKQEDGFKKYKLYVPGHGPSSGSTEKTIDPFLNYMKIIVAGAQKAYKDGIESYEIKPEVDKQLKNYHSWDAYEGQMGKHLMKAYEEVEALDL
ncbi:MAG: MBL fold metallo-hydrolase [Sulfurimonas sp.]|jgi:glyoxylase-like metal-dependent hydrolase (beta-lactamase superfamily II)|uniref:MBL fold metallo-hydrolase n=1 Tax=unclassified Sulfurimonas TaxID=2623549 RepID=UPI0008CE83CE|nr:MULTISPECIES: MBL fold metallo-hydrolase [unclassified Sulfurimonas]OHE08166.1 MAG: MBL fold metallo-hydrolase [Sulfurimonas sp. RIFOXYC2_FULL_36_7]OHE11747.1 MAG: MBL fold metallo-hydrolase [Sulfurimonas sp. RIFOXYD12_FULL_36_11]MBS4068757.1 MBL fold metallo-hydrolase [Sulfurimonas sp.]MDD3854395.1 MBL fold metallo-hydrolase [Sulfurimonas sp.]OHE03288.1 MAG: MBL fold metallo-hydrolase [Sulfurimonas sp. RIFOXYB12_FULL_35_9]